MSTDRLPLLLLMPRHTRPHRVVLPPNGGCCRCCSPARRRSASAATTTRSRSASGLLLLVVLAEAWNLMAGYGGLVSLGTASFFGVGAYLLTGLVNRADAPLALALVAGGLAAAAMAGVVSRHVFRLRGLYFTVGTLALAEALRLFMINYNGFGGATGLFLRGTLRGCALYGIALALLAVATVVMTIATRSRFSILLRAVRDDEDAAAQIGVRAFRVKLAAFVVASFADRRRRCAAGPQARRDRALRHLRRAVDRHRAVDRRDRRPGVARRAAGRRRLRRGLERTARRLAGMLHLAITGVILIVVIRYAPQGLVGLAQRLWRRN